jgi:hypothetical protein
MGRNGKGDVFLGGCWRGVGMGREGGDGDDDVRRVVLWDVCVKGSSRRCK